MGRFENGLKHHEKWTYLIYLNIKVTEVDENLLKFRALEELTLSANRIITVNSKNLPTSLKVSLSTLCTVQDL